MIQKTICFKKHNHTTDCIKNYPEIFKIVNKPTRNCDYYRIYRGSNYTLEKCEICGKLCEYVAKFIQNGTYRGDKGSVCTRCYKIFEETKYNTSDRRLTWCFGNGV